MDSGPDHSAFSIVRNVIVRGPIPGAAVAVGGLGGVQTACFGRISGATDAAPVTPDTIYDLASLTKVMVTVTLLMRAIQDGQLEASAPLGMYLPEVAGFDLEDATILELASHSSGLAAFSPLRFWGLPREQALRRALQEKRVGTRGQVVYSDQGYIVLGYLLERVLGARLDVLAERVFGPLGLELTFHPDPTRCADTEVVASRGGVVRGRVHDENAEALEGISGHAGLFGTVSAVAGFITAMLEGQLLFASSMAFMFAEHAVGLRDRRAFGWVRRYDGWSGGDAAPDTALGHTGFTGTGMWFDPVSTRFLVLLTNRVHPSRHTETGIAELRRACGDAVWTA
jgi:CubicO group peptidase (beta-lactamase class C family)